MVLPFPFPFFLFPPLFPCRWFPFPFPFLLGEKEKNYLPFSLFSPLVFPFSFSTDFRDFPFFPSIFF